MPADTHLQVRWDRSRAIVNLRGDPADAGFVDAVTAAVGLPRPTQAGQCPADAARRIVWAGPDDWFVLGEPGAEGAIAAALRAAAGARHHAVTDVSSGYCVLRLAGPPARDVLAQGCPQDFHPRAFPVGRCTGTHFYKASVWLWRTDDDAFELLVRSSFVGYVALLLKAGTLECGMIQG
jgi:sarcosine oxidase subunit gamma